jgi:hypothetical protein
MSPLPATQLRVLMHRVGRGEHARSIRRVFPFDCQRGVFNELHTAYLDNEHGLASLNAQKAVLSDLRSAMLHGLLQPIVRRRIKCPLPSAK